MFVMLITASMFQNNLRTTPSSDAHFPVMDVVISHHCDGAFLFKKMEGTIYKIPNLIIVGYDRSQILMHQCVSCKKRFIAVCDDDLFCENCETKDLKTPQKNISEVQYAGHIVGWDVEVPEGNKRNRYNYQKVFKRDQYTCQYCGYSPAYFIEQFKPLSIDHIRPFSRGGSNKMNNLVVACMECNHMVYDKLFSDFTQKKYYVLDKRKERKLKVYFGERSELKNKIVEYMLSRKGKWKIQKSF